MSKRKSLNRRTWARVQRAARKFLRRSPHVVTIDGARFVVVDVALRGGVDSVAFDFAGGAS